MSDPQYAKYPDLSLAQHVFQLSNPSLESLHSNSLEVLTKAIKEQSLAPLYRHLAHPTDGKQGVLEWDEKLYEELKEKNEKELRDWEDKLKEAEEKAGESEIVEAMGGRVEFWARVGDKEKALQAYNDVYDKTPSLGAKIDIVLAMVRMGMFFDDKVVIKKNIERARGLIESGGDWDRRNRLKAFSALYNLTIRAYDVAAPLLLDSLSTFTSTEVCTYETLVLYAVLAGAISLPRVDFKARIVDGAEVLAVFGSRRDSNLRSDDILMTEVGAQARDTALGSFESLEGLVNNLYLCNYSNFFVALAEVEEKFLKRDKLLAEHRRWYVREMRRRSYAQLLESYKVVGTEKMAEAFGVSVDFLDRDLSSFIPSGALNCTIDRVNGNIETNRPDNKNKQYQDVVKQGDQLITKLQKFGQAVRLRGSERG